MIDNDDELKGRLLSRREMLGLFGAAGAASAVVLAGCSSDSDAPAQATSALGQGEAASPTATASAGSGAAAGATSVPSCVVIPALTEGPYFVDEKLERVDIRPDPNTGQVRQGVQFNLTVNVLQVSGTSCRPLADAMVDVWQCDAVGAYSDVNDNMTGSTMGQKWLRGYQNTDSAGQASFTTIYPGWYPGRATHIHFKVRKGNEEFTSQWFFDDSLSDQIHSQLETYSAKGANGRQQNSRDGIYRQCNGLLTLEVARNGDVYEAGFSIGVKS
jgi:protocatechuate 3,4-dioxygenase beta subunit